MDCYNINTLSIINLKKKCKELNIIKYSSKNKLELIQMIKERIKTESPIAESPIAESPIAESPIAESPIAESPIAESPIAESPIAESPIAEKENIIFNNQYVLSIIQKNKILKNLKIIQELKQITPLLNDADLIKLYNKSISIHQSKNQENGNFLENDILVSILEKNNISYKKQVTINKLGIIIGFNEKKIKCYHIIDFVIGENIEIGRLIIDYKVISCKTTCRERWTQDDWSYIFIPKLYILLTISDDYPAQERFREGTKRKIITCLPKKKDDRIFKLNFEDLINELIL